MKRMLWFSRGEKPIIELVLSEESAQWIADHIPTGDRARDELVAAMVECSGLETALEYGTNTGHGHVWPRPDGVKARCGGPGLCAQCSRDEARQAAAQDRAKKQV